MDESPRDSVQGGSPLARYRRPSGEAGRPKPPLRVGGVRNGQSLTARQQMHADLDMTVLRLSRAIPVGLTIPAELLATNEDMERGFERCDIERFRRGLKDYQTRLWDWIKDAK